MKQTNMKFVVIFALSISLWGSSRSRVYERCPLARELYYVHGMDRDQIPYMLCYVESLTAYDTSLVSRAEDGAGANYGFFQFNSQWWCSESGGGKGPRDNLCGAPCSALADDNIGDDVKCAMENISKLKINVTVDTCVENDLRMYLDGCHI